jgi:hypothetical protein
MSAKLTTGNEQTKFCSDPNITRGLSANLVAKKLQGIKSPELREIILLLQYFSHQPGGLGKFASELCAKYPDRVATKEMQQLGFKTGQIYSGEQVKCVRARIPGLLNLRLKGEISFIDYMALPQPQSRWEEMEGSEFQLDRAAQSARLQKEANAYPAEYPAAMFKEACDKAAAENLEDCLAELCLNPGVTLEQTKPWYFPELIATLYEWEKEHRQEIQNSTVWTTIGKSIEETVAYGWQTKCLVVIEGILRTGKSFAAEKLCRMYPGRYRYVQVPPTADELTFFRAIAEAVGVGIRGTAETRDRVTKALRDSGLMLIFDESHYLFPWRNRVEGLPSRVNWLMVELVNQNVPCALITTEQFQQRLSYIVEQTGWAAGQLIYRIGHRVSLPDRLTIQELKGIAKALLPDADKLMIDRLAAHGAMSQGGCATMAYRAKRAQFLAESEGRTIPDYSDLVTAIEEDAGTRKLAPKEKKLTAKTKPLNPKKTVPAPEQPTGPKSGSGSRVELNHLFGE